MMMTCKRWKWKSCPWGGPSVRNQVFWSYCTTAIESTTLITSTCHEHFVQLDSTCQYSRNILHPWESSVACMSPESSTLVESFEYNHAHVVLPMCLKRSGPTAVFEIPGERHSFQCRMSAFCGEDVCQVTADAWNSHHYENHGIRLAWLGKRPLNSDYQFWISIDNISDSRQFNQQCQETISIDSPIDICSRPSASPPIVRCSTPHSTRPCSHDIGRSNHILDRLLVHPRTNMALLGKLQVELVHLQSSWYEGTVRRSSCQASKQHSRIDRSYCHITPS